MKFDLIISNPPYQVGNEITRNIIENIDFDEFINLMPLSKYRKNSLYKHVKEVEDMIPNVFEDADTNAQICVVEKSLSTYSKIHYSEFEIYAFRKITQKYFLANLKRQEPWQFLERSVDVFDPRAFYFTIRTFVDGVHKTENCADWQMNFNHVNTYTNGKCPFLLFATPEERDNACNYWYTSNLMTFLCKNSPKQGGWGTSPLFFPRVDWTRSWTDEEILKDYGYSNEEIEEILHYNDDLIPKNWKKGV